MRRRHAQRKAVTMIRRLIRRAAKFLSPVAAQTDEVRMFPEPAGRTHTMGLTQIGKSNEFTETVLRKVEIASSGTPELDSDFAAVFPSAPRKVTRSIDAAVQLITRELPGWWWTCGYCSLSNDSSL
jgi:hypothetical protein